MNSTGCITIWWLNNWCWLAFRQEYQSDKWPKPLNWYEPIIRDLPANLVTTLPNDCFSQPISLHLIFNIKAWLAEFNHNIYPEGSALAWLKLANIFCNSTATQDWLTAHHCTEEDLWKAWGFTVEQIAKIQSGLFYLPDVLLSHPGILIMADNNFA
jgi:hypothetical protein